MRDESYQSARAAWLRNADSRKVDVVATSNERGSARFQLDDDDHLHKALDAMGQGFWDWDLTNRRSVLQRPLARVAGL